LRVSSLKQATIFARQLKIYSEFCPRLIVIYLIERKISLHVMDIMLLGGSKYVRSIQFLVFEVVWMRDDRSDKDYSSTSQV